MSANKSWRVFGEENGGQPSKTWPGVNYLDVCRASMDVGDQDAADVQAGVIRTINGEVPDFYFEYPCHSPCEKRWFMMSLCPLYWNGPSHFVVSHQNITERKLAELRIEKLASLEA